MTSHKDYVETIKQTAINTGVTALKKVILKKVPYLFWGPISGITGFVLEKVVTILVQETEFGIFFLYVDLRTDAQGRAFSSAAIKNQEAQLKGTPEEKAKAEAELIDAFKKFVTLGS